MLHAPTHPNSQLNAPIHHTKGTHQSQSQSQSQTNLTQNSQATNLFTPPVIKSQVSPTTSSQLYPAPNQAPPPPNYPSSSSHTWGHNIQRNLQLPPGPAPDPAPAPATTALPLNMTGIIHWALKDHTPFNAPQKDKPSTYILTYSLANWINLNLANLWMNLFTVIQKGCVPMFKIYN